MLYINHEKKAIYIHIPKTAGTYIGHTLTHHYGFVGYLKLLLRRRPDHDIVCKTKDYKFVPCKVPKRSFTFYNKLIGILVYCKTSDYINKVCGMTAEKWDTYTKFCFIRNPYDRARSGVDHINKVYNHNLSIHDYLHQDPLDVPDIEHGHVFMSQKRQIADVDGKCGVDIIGRFENLEDDLRHILQTIGFTSFTHTPKKLNVTNKEESDEIKLSTAVVGRVNTLFDDDFEAFHYKKIEI